MSRWVVVAREGELAPGEYKLVEVEDLELALFNVDGSIFCIEDLCLVLLGYRGCQVL